MIRDLLEIHINQDTVLLGRWGLFANFPPALRNNICSETLIRRILVDGDAVRSLRRFVALEGSAGLAANCSDHAFMRILKGQLGSGRIEVVLLPHTLPMRMLSGRPAPVREAPPRMAAGRSGSGARVPVRGIGPAAAGFQTAAATSHAVRPSITPSQVRSQPAGSPVLDGSAPLRGGGPAAAGFGTAVPAPPADRSATKARKPVSQRTAEERIAFVVENAAGKVPGELGQALLALLSPENLALMVLVVGLFIGAHAMGWGLLADVAIVAVAYMYAGFYAVLALKDLGECFARTASAQSEQDLGIAADALVRAVAGIGVAGLSAILHRVATRQAGGGSSAPGKASNATKQPQPESRPAGRASSAKAVEEPPAAVKVSSAGGNAQKFHRTPEQLDDLIRDPAHNGKVRKNAFKEREAGLGAEEKGIIKGPITRDLTGKAEFVDADGTLWDVKSFNSNHPPKKGGFNLNKASAKVEEELELDENVIIDTREMAKEHIEILKKRA